MRGLLGWFFLAYLYYLVLFGKLAEFFLIAQGSGQGMGSTGSTMAAQTAASTAVGTVGGVPGVAAPGFLANPGQWLP